MSARGGVRERFGRIVEQAADAGYPDAMSLLALTPVEIELNLRAFASRRRARREELDTAAWLAGRYAAIGWHAPRRYPRRPETVRRENMSDEDIKGLFVRLAERGGET